MYFYSMQSNFIRPPSKSFRLTNGNTLNPYLNEKERGRGRTATGHPTPRVNENAFLEKISPRLVPVCPQETNEHGYSNQQLFDFGCVPA